jgi:hypothetical protein
MRSAQAEGPAQMRLGARGVADGKIRKAEVLQDRGIVRVAFDHALNQRDRFARVPARQPDHPEQMQGLGMAGRFPKNRAAQPFRARKVPGLEAADGFAKFPFQSA